MKSINNKFSSICLLGIDKRNNLDNSCVALNNCLLSLFGKKLVMLSISNLKRILKVIWSFNILRKTREAIPFPIIRLLKLLTIPIAINRPGRFLLGVFVKKLNYSAFITLHRLHDKCNVYDNLHLSTT